VVRGSRAAELTPPTWKVAGSGADPSYVGFVWGGDVCKLVDFCFIIIS